MANQRSELERLFWQNYPEEFDDLEDPDDFDVEAFAQRIEALPEPYQRAMRTLVAMLAAGHTFDITLAVLLQIIQSGDA